MQGFFRYVLGDVVGSTPFGVVWENTISAVAKPPGLMQGLSFRLAAVFESKKTVRVYSSPGPSFDSYKIPRSRTGNLLDTSSVVVYA